MNDDEHLKWLKGVILDDEMSGIRNYLKVVDAYLVEEQRKLTRWFNEYMEAPHNLEADHYILENFNDAHHQAHGTFPTILSNSTLIAICSFAEVKMRQLCIEDRAKRIGRELTEVEKIDLSKELKQRDGVRNYWRENGIQIACGSEWQKVQQVFDVRNQIVHSDGELDEHPRCPSIRAYVKAREDKGIKSLAIINDYIIVLNEYCEEALALVKALLLMQMAAIPE